MIWVGGPGAAERQWVALLFDGDLEIWLVGSHESRHAGQQVGASCPHVAEVLFAFDVPLPPVWSSLGALFITGHTIGSFAFCSQREKHRAIIPATQTISRLRQCLRKRISTSQKINE